MLFKQMGGVAYLKQGVVLSGRRWGDRKLFKNVIILLWLFTRYLVERRFGNITSGNQKYYIAYCGQQ